MRILLGFQNLKWSTSTITTTTTTTVTTILIIVIYLSNCPTSSLGATIRTSQGDNDPGSTVPGKNSDDTNLTTLRLVQLMYRHGDRTPVVQYPKDPLQNESLWPEGFSALTKKGKLMQYTLGRYLRQRYDGFLSRLYSPKEIFIQSSDADRAIMSAMANLAGLFPSTSFPPIDELVPVHAVPDSLDNFINFKADCPRAKELKKEYFQRSPFAQKINSEHQDLYAYLTNHTGLNVTDFELVSDLYDTLSIQVSYNLTLPEWTKQVFPDKMEPLAPLPFDARVQVPTLEAQRIKCGPLLTKLIKNMDAMRAFLSHEDEGTKRPPKMYMISGHDSTSSVFLGTLGVFDTQFPSYASMAILEMHQLPVSINDKSSASGLTSIDNSDSQSSSSSDKTDFYVKVFFRNETTVPPYEFVLPNCGYPCPLDQFKELYKDVIVDDQEWKLDCKSKN